MHILDRFFNGKVYGPVLNERFVFSAFDLSETTILIIAVSRSTSVRAIAMPNVNGQAFG
jgi:hypothetical protein